MKYFNDKDRMNRRFFLVFTLIFLVLAGNGFCTDVFFDLTEVPGFGASPATNRQVTVQQRTPFVGNVKFLALTGADGRTTNYNAAVGLIDCQIKAPPAAISFQIYVTATNLGTIDALTIPATGSASTYPAGSVAWSIFASDQRYQLSGTTLSNTFYPLFSNPSNYVPNATLITASNGIVSIINLNGGTNGLATTNFVLSQGYVSQSVTNGLATTNYVNSVAAAAGVTNGLATTNYVNGITNGLATTNWVIGVAAASGITNGLATTNYVNGITNGLATVSYVGGITNGLATTNYVNSATNGFVVSTITNGFATTNWTRAVFYPTSNPSLFVDGTITNGLATISFVNTNPVASSNLTGTIIAQISGDIANATNYQGSNVVGTIPALVATNTLILADILSATNNLSSGAFTTVGNAAIASTNTMTVFASSNLVSGSSVTNAIIWNQVANLISGWFDATGSGFNSNTNAIAFSLDARGTNDSSLTIGYRADGGDNGTAIGKGAVGRHQGVAVGADAYGYDQGVAIGFASTAAHDGIAIGFNTGGDTAGTAVGFSAIAQNQGIAIGNTANVGTYGATEDNTGDIAIGSDGTSTLPAKVPSGMQDTTEIGRGTAISNGWFHYRGIPVVNGNGTLGILNASGLTNGVFLTNGLETVKDFTNQLYRTNWAILSVVGTNGIVITNFMMTASNAVYVAGTNAPSSQSAYNATNNIGISSGLMAYTSSNYWASLFQATNIVINNYFFNIYSNVTFGSNNVFTTGPNNGALNAIAIGNSNVISSDTAGNSYYDYVLGGMQNTNIGGNYSTIINGTFNYIASQPFEMIGNGFGNFVHGEWDVILQGNRNLINDANVNGFNTILNGNGNTANGGGSGSYNIVATGSTNTIPIGFYSTILNGWSNNVVSAGPTISATILGGSQNTVKGSYSTIAGGATNTIIADYGFAFGSGANLKFNNSVMFSDGSFVTNTAAKQFLVYAGSGVGINTNANNGYSLNVNGAINAVGSSINGVGLTDTNLFFSKSVMINCNTNFIQVVGAGTSAANGTNVWSGVGFGSWTNISGGATISNSSSGVYTLYVAGIASYTSAYPAGTPWTATAGAAPAPTTGYFTNGLSGSSNISIGSTNGTSTFSTIGLTTNIQFVVLQAGVTNYQTLYFTNGLLKAVTTP